MGRLISDAELRRQIAREGERWGLVPMESAFGDVLVGEEVPCVLPLSPGIMYIDRVQRDITKVSQDYPFSAVLRNRKRKAERMASLRSEITEVAYQTAIQTRLAEIHAEMAADIRRTDKQKVMRYGNDPVRR